MVGGVEYSLKHLQDKVYSYSIPAQGAYPQLDFEVLVQYSSHCVSWGPKRDEEIDFSIHGKDARVLDDKGIARCFCPTRHQLSHELPEVFSTLDQRWCFFTGYENWLTIQRLNQSGETEDYECYFRLTRQGNAFLRVYVESAYIRTGPSQDRQPHRFRHHDKMRGVLLLAKKLRKEPLKRPSRRR